MGFTDGSNGKESACNAGDLGLIPGSGRSPGEGNGNALQYSCLENSMDRRAWHPTDHGVTESDTNEHQSTHASRDKMCEMLLFSNNVLLGLQTKVIALKMEKVLY